VAEEMVQQRSVLNAVMNLRVKEFYNRQGNSRLAERLSDSQGLPNVETELLALHLRIRGILGSNLGPKTDYPDLGFS
jgi:hypothetical protein